MVRLHEFMQRNPHADLDQCLQGQSDVFKGFVKRGLKRIEELNSLPPTMQGKTFFLFFLMGFFGLKKSFIWTKNTF